MATGDLIVRIASQDTLLSVLDEWRQKRETAAVLSLS